MKVGRVIISTLLLCASIFAQTPNAQVQETPLPHGWHGIIVHSEITFSFIPRGVEDAAWVIDVHPDRSGTYGKKSEPADKAQAITVSDATLQKLENGYGEAFVAHACETKQKKIAQTGKKSLTYVQGVAFSSCDFNYSDDDKLNETATIFIAIATTMQTGEQLAKLHRFDRLGLDAEMQTFADEVKAGRAVEVQNIAPVLQSIAADDRVIERVRRIAARLLQDAGVAVDAIDASRRTALTTANYLG